MEMNFVDYSFELFQHLSQMEFISETSDSENSLKKVVKKIAKIYSSETLVNVYVKECDYMVKSTLTNYLDDIEDLINQKSINNYHKAMSFYTLIYFFWIWDHEFNMDHSQLKDLQKSIYLDALGYKMLDEATDNVGGSGQLVYLGLNAIRKAEKILQDIFPNADVLKIMDKNQSLLSEYEYVEKRNRWSQCPINWDTAYKMGYKAAPLFSVYEIIADNFKFDELRMENLIQGMLNTTAAMQIMDDFSDALEDLRNGIETLVTLGFYSKFGNNSNIKSSNVEEFLDQERLKKIFMTVNSLFQNARVIFHENNDYILSLFNEIQNYRFYEFFIPTYAEEEQN